MGFDLPGATRKEEGKNPRRMKPGADISQLLASYELYFIRENRTTQKRLEFQNERNENFARSILNEMAREELMKEQQEEIANCLQKMS